MTHIDVCQAADCGFDEDAVAAALRAHRYPRIPSADGLRSRYEVSNEVTLDELLERLEPHRAAADVYLPVTFDAPFRVGELRFGAVAKLLRGLDELRDELELDLPKDSRSPSLARLRNLWRGLRKAAKGAKTARLCIAIVREG